MKIETMKRAQHIQHRLRELKTAREYWEHPGVLHELSVYMAFNGWEANRATALPAPIERFKRECLDAIATEEAALRAEFDAL